MNLPVVVHRWFHRGEGWAFHPILQPKLVKIIKTVEARLTLRSHERFSYEFDDGELVGEVYPDMSCADRLAVGRNPSVLRVAYSRKKLSDAESDEVYERLDEFALPDFEGPHEQLEIRLRGEPTIVSEKATTTPSCTLDNCPKADQIKSLRSAEWGIIVALSCVLVSAAYSTLRPWDVVRSSVDLMLLSCLARTFYVIRHGNVHRSENGTSKGV